MRGAAMCLLLVHHFLPKISAPWYPKVAKVSYHSLTIVLVPMLVD